MAKKTGSSENAPKFPIDKLGKYCMELYGCSSTTFAGATAGLTGEYTVEEMEEIIKKWSKKEAQ